MFSSGRVGHLRVNSIFLLLATVCKGIQPSCYIYVHVRITKYGTSVLLIEDFFLSFILFLFLV